MEEPFRFLLNSNRIINEDFTYLRDFCQHYPIESIIDLSIHYILKKTSYVPFNIYKLY